MANANEAKAGSIWAFIFSLTLAAASYLSSGFFVHTYCENRPVMVVLAIAGVGTIYLALRSWPLGTLRKIGAILAVVFCLLEVTLNVWFFVWATRVCAAQKRLLLR